jgi:hypothetical protein
MPKTSSIILKILIQNHVLANKYYIGTCRGEDASIASLQGIKKTDELDSLTVVFDCSINREMRLYHERAKAIRPYNMV